MSILVNTVICTALSTDCSVGFVGLRTNQSRQIWISSGDPDPSATAIRKADLPPIAKIRASEILREARATGADLKEDFGTAGDAGLVMEFAGPHGRELMITVSGTGTWTYFSAAIDGSQTAAGILRDDGLKTAIRWAAGVRDDLTDPGVIVG